MTSLILYSIPLAIYALIVKWKNKAEWHDIAQRLGLTVGKKPYYWWALGFAVAGVAFSWAVWYILPENVKNEQSIAMSRFSGKKLTIANVIALIVFGMIETGLG
ncbi:MAG: hypothetical protein D6704_03960, partial [Nitrospirae bacterium]